MKPDFAMSKCLLVVCLLSVVTGLSVASSTSAYKTAIHENTIDSYRKYLRQYPDSKHSAEARDKLIQLSFENAKTIDSMEAYVEFLRLLPNSVYSTTVHSRMEQLAFDSVQAANTVESCRGYLHDFVDGAHATEVRAQLEELVYAAAQHDNGDETLVRFLSEFPASVHSKEVKAKLEGSAFERARSIDTAQACITFLDAYPDGKFSAEMRKNFDAFPKTQIVPVKSPYEQRTSYKNTTSWFANGQLHMKTVLEDPFEISIIDTSAPSAQVCIIRSGASAVEIEAAIRQTSLGLVKQSADEWSIKEFGGVYTLYFRDGLLWRAMRLS